MYDFIRKAEYFDWWDRGLAEKTNRSLKNIQDAWVLSELVDGRGLRLCEVGGGQSRVLRELAKANACVNADKLEGAGNGPKAIPEIPGVEVIPVYLGDFDPRLVGASFDAVFSISVVEHIPDEALAPSFADMARILKPGGRLLHAIDIFLFDDPVELSRLRLYFEACTQPGLGLRWEREPAITAERGWAAPFRCDYASQSDQQLASRNKSLPHLRETRAATQACSIKLAMVKE